MRKGKWKMTKFWDTISLDVGKYEQGWNYEVAFWSDEDGVIDEEYFENKQQAEQYLEEMIKGEK